MRNYEQYISDISDLTGIPKYQVIKLMKIFRLIVGHEIYECIKEDLPKYESFCLGLGKLEVEYNPYTDDYDVSFKLSKDMKLILNQVLDEQRSPIEGELDKALVANLISKFNQVLIDG